MKKWWENWFGSNEKKKEPENQKAKDQKTQKSNPKSSSTGSPTAKPAAAKKADPKINLIEKKKSKSLETVTTRQPTDQFGSRLSALNGGPPGQNMFDVCAYIILCKHQKVAISTQEKTEYVWLPFISLSPKQTWTDGSIDGVNIVLSGGDPNKCLALKENPAIDKLHCLQMFRLQLPQTQKFNTRLIYFVKLKENVQCCTQTSRLKWVNIQDIKDSKIENLWGLELVTFVKDIFSGTAGQHVNEYSLDEAFTYVPRDPPRNLEEEMLKSTNFTEKDVERLYIDFIEHCFPSFMMTLTSFSDYMSKYGFEKRDKKLELLFRAFNFNNNNFLGFHEFLLGLTSIDPNATNGQSRVKFVFKYYDLDNDGHLNQKEFTTMIREMNPKDSEADIKKKVEDQMKIFKANNQGVSFDDFFHAVGSRKFRGTSNLCRSNRPILAQISRSIANRTLKKTVGATTLGSIVSDQKYKGICQSCKEKKYEYAIHLVKINVDGMCCDPQPLPELSQIERSESLDKVTEIGSSGPKSDLNSDSKTNLSTGSKSGITNLTREKFSNEFVWNPKSVANYLIEQIRIFNTKKGPHKDNRGLMDGKDERQPFVKMVKDLCSEVEKIVSQEERCLQVQSPAFVIGDIHGNLEDLFTMERVLWKSYPIVAANYVFLGDYVDRGKWGLECSLYLMCLKLLAPNKFILLRGNHEVRDLQKNYSYRSECIRKYGEALGLEVWEVTNRVFDKMPFCAVIDDAIFCAHGGIPCTVRQIEKINQVKNDLRDPEHESAPAWEILWSDPIDPQKFAETAELLKVRVDSARGFLTNIKRGAGFLFGEEAVNTFLQSNGLTHIIRAHEVPAQGFTFHFGNKCTTIFSCSHYCGNNNEAACVHIDNEKLRIVKLDTVNNAPSMDS